MAPFFSRGGVGGEGGEGVGHMRVLDGGTNLRFVLLFVVCCLLLVVFGDVESIKP